MANSENVYSSAYRSGRRRIHPLALVLLFVLAAALIFGLVCSDILNGAASGAGRAGPEIQPSAAAPAPEGYVLRTMTQADMGAGDLILVSNAHPCLLPDSGDLVCVYDAMTGPYSVRDKEVLLSGRLMDALDAMMTDFHTATGQSFMNVTSGYRSKDDQQRVYDNNAAQYGEAHTRTFVSQPGCSEHQTGLAFDLNIYYAQTGDCNEFENVPESSWILEHAWEYGFVQRYEQSKTDITGISNEPWHFRYVGPVHAKQMHDADMCLEEYVDSLRSYDFFDEHLHVSQGGQAYEIYYCAGADVYLPESGTYTYSGNNIDGFIVTVAQ